MYTTMMGSSIYLALFYLARRFLFSRKKERNGEQKNVIEKWTPLILLSARIHII